jgi:DNA mismatch repair protein MSH6
MLIASWCPQRQVIRRELCAILSKGTRTFCYLDEFGSDKGGVAEVPLLLAIKERITPTADEDEPHLEYGVCIVDPTTFSFQLGQFADDSQRRRLRTLLSQCTPTEVRGAAGPGAE